MKVQFGSRLFLLVMFLLLASTMACSKTGNTTPAALTPAPPDVSSVQTAKPLTARDRMAMDEFVKQQEAIDQEWNQFYQDFDHWRTELTSCQRSSAQEALQDFAATFNSVTQQARDIPRTSSTRDLADILIAAAEEEEAAFRQLRDRWQPQNVSFFELVEQRRSNAARAQNKVEDLVLELQEKFREGPTPEELAAVEEFATAFDSVKEAWGKLHDTYILLRKEDDRLDRVALVDRYEQLIQQLNEIVAMISELPDTEATESMVERLQEAAEAEVAALMNLTKALATLAYPAPAATPGTNSETEESTPSPPGPGIMMDSLLDEADVAYHEIESNLKEVGRTIKEIVDDDSAESLVEVEDFEGHYEKLLVEWDAFHQRYNDWRRTEGGCDRVEVLQALDQFNRRVGELGRKVRYLPQSGFLLPMYTLLVEAAEREEGAMRALYNSWRPFTIDAFKAVGQERVNSDRLRRQANIGLEELRNRP